MKTRVFSRVVVALVAAGWLAAASSAAISEAGPKTAKEQLSAAYAVKKQSFKKDDDEKRRILLLAVEEYRKVLSMFPNDREANAVATFRMGEIHRTLRDFVAAERAFQSVLTFDDQRTMVARAFLELGHLARRDKRYDQAVELYTQVTRQCAEVRDQAARAQMWIAKCLRTQKIYPEARTALRAVIDVYSDETKSVLSAYDLLAITYLDEGNPKMAAEVLRECRDHFAALEATGDKAYLGIGDRVAKLKAWKKLEKASKPSPDA